MSKSQPQQYSAERTEQLLHAAAEGDATLVEALLGAGAYINGTNYNLQTPLIRAAFFGHVDVVRVLLDHGAEVESKDRLGLNAQDWATKRGFPEVARMLPASSAAMATTLDGTPQPDLSGVTLADTGQAEVATPPSPPSPPSQSEDTEVRLDGEPTQPLLHLSAFAREMQRRHEESHGSTAPKHEEFSATMVDGPTLEDARQEDPPPYEDQPTLEDARTFDDPPTVALSELPTQMLGDPPTRPLDKFATQLLDEPPTGSLKEFAPQTLAESSTRPLKGIPPPPKSLVPGQTPPTPKSLVPESLPTTAPLSEGATVAESGSRSISHGRPLTWIVLAIIAVAAIVAAYLMYSRRQVQPVAEPKVAGKATVPQGAFAGSEVSLQLGKGQPTSSTETTTANAGTSNTTLGPDSYPRVTGSLKGSEVSLPDLVTPPTARNRWRRGLINVAVTVGSDGKVISARPLNGQSVWRQAAKDAALKAQFKPQSDAAVRSGKITYHFGPLGQS